MTPKMVHRGAVNFACFSPDQRKVATASSDGTARIWDAASGEALTPALEHQNWVTNVSFSPDGMLLATASADNTARIWDVVTGEPISPALPHHGRVNRVAFSPKGDYVATASDDGAARLWPVPSDHALLEDSDSLQLVLSGCRVDDSCNLSVAETSQLQASWESLQTKQPDAFRVDAKQRKLWREETLERLQARGEERMASKDWDGAIRALSQAIQLAPDLPERHAARGHLFSTMQDWDKAIGDFTRAIELQPDEATYRNNRALAYCQVGQWTGAVNDLSESIRIQSDREITHHWRALACLGAGDPMGYRDACMRMMQQLAASEKASTCHWVAWACALAPEAISDLVQAVEKAGHAVSEEPDADEHINTLGAALYRAGSYEEAVEWLNEIAQQKPSGGPCWPTDTCFFIAMAHHHLGHKEDGQTWRKKAIDLAQEETRGSSTVAWDRRLTLNLLRTEAESLLARPDADAQVSNQRSPQPSGEIPVALGAPYRWALHYRRAKQFAAKRNWRESVNAFSQAIKMNPDNASMYVHRSIAHREDGDYSRAIDDCTSALRVDPRLSAAFHNRAIARRVSGHYNEAVEDTNTGLRFDPHNPWLLWERALNYIHLGAHDKAIGDYNTAIKLTQDNPDLYADRAEAYLWLGRYDEALADCFTYLDLRPDDEVAALIRAQMLLMAGRIEEYRGACWLMSALWRQSDHPGKVHCVARAHVLAAMISDPKRAVELAKQTQTKFPQLAGVIHTLGMAHLRAGELEEAAQRFDESLKADANWPARCLNWFGLAIVHFQRGETEEARQRLGQAVEFMVEHPAPAREDRLEAQLLRREVEQLLGTPKDWLIYCHRARIYLRMGEPDKAIADYNKALELKPKDHYLYRLRGDVRRQLKQWDQAVEDYSVAIRLKPAVRDLCSRAGVYGVLGEYEKAEADARRAVEIAPKDRLGWLMLLDIEFSRGGSAETTQAIVAEAEAALGGASDVLVQHAAWNLLLDRRGEYEKICRESVARFGDSKDPEQRRRVASAATLTDEPVVPTKQLVEMVSRDLDENPPAWTQDGLGWCLLRDGQEEAAIERFHQSLGRDWNGEPMSWLGLAIAHSKLDRAREAEDWLGKAQAWFERHPLDLTSEMFPSARLTCQLLLRESEQVINRKPSSVDDGAAKSP